MNPDAKPSERVEIVRATIMVGEVETQYRRAGAGPSLLVLRALADTPLLELAAYARVIVPDTTTIAALTPDLAGRHPFVQWIAGFLEGLGVTVTTVLAPASLAPELSELAKAQPGVVRRVLLYGARREVSFPVGVDVCWMVDDADIRALLG